MTKKNGEYWDWEKDKKGLTWDEFNAQGWLSSYKINEVYFVSEERSLFRSGYCFNLTPKFGEKVGSLYFEGGSWPCNGGSAAFSDRMFVQLDYPFKAQIIEQTKGKLK